MQDYAEKPLPGALRFKLKTRCFFLADGITSGRAILFDETRTLGCPAS